jgi:FolB domain-containing protein
MQSSIWLKSLSLDVNLGWPEEERLTKQTVFVDIQLRFEQPPLACQTDDLSHTYCYDTLVNQLKINLLTRSFKLLEHLGYELFKLVKQSVGTQTSVLITITKNPNIADLTNGVCFSYGDDKTLWSF